MKNTTPPHAYHHGNARNALLKAAGEILETSGAAGLALRQLAERAGLSRQAPYNHFADKQALLAELVRQGFERLGEEMKAAANSDLSPIARLTKAGASYIAFAQQTPALFRLMFSKELVDLSCYPKASDAAENSFGHLSQIVAALTAPESVADMSLVAWSLVHGYATLCIETGLESPEFRDARAALFTRAVLGSVPSKA